MRLLAILAVLILSCLPACADKFVAISFHDVVDDPGKLGPDDISTDQLVGFFDWLAGNGWSSISLDDIAAARTGKKPLPPHAILLTFDDGYAGHYTRVYPLLRAYGFHAVFFLVGSWMEGAPGGTVRYGDADVPRERFLSWDQAREMAASGLAEFGSHSYGLHQGIAGNPQGSKPPAAATWAYDAVTGNYETDIEQHARIAADLQRSVALMRAQLGKAPRALAWPFGRSSGPATAAARQAGFTYLMGLAAEPADTDKPLDIQRLYPTANPKLKAIAPSLYFDDPDPEQNRVACLNLDGIAGGSAAEADAALGRMIEAIRRLGPSMVVLDPFAATQPGEAARAAWFKSALLPTRSDLLPFAAWQIRSRAGVEVFLRLDLHEAAAAVGRERALELVREVVRAAPVDGVVLDAPGPFLAGGATRVPHYPWTVRAERKRIAAAPRPDDQLTLQAWQAAEETRPDLRLGIVAPSPLPGDWPAPSADMVLLKPSDQDPAAIARGMASRGRIDPAVSSRLLLPLPADQPDTAAEKMRQAQALGASGFALCPAPTLPASPAISAAFSSARFPRLP